MRLHIADFLEMAQAVARRVERERDWQMQVVAWQTAHLINYSGNVKRPVKPTKLYKSIYDRRKDAENSRRVNKEYVYAEQAKLKEKFDL
jgi:hypothetical protein